MTDDKDFGVFSISRLPRLLFLVSLILTLAMASALTFSQFLGTVRNDASRQTEKVEQLVADVADDLGGALYTVGELINCRCSGDEEGCSQGIVGKVEREIDALGRSQLYVSVRARRLFSDNAFSEEYSALIQDITSLAQLAKARNPTSCEELSLKHEKLENDIIRYLSSN